MPQTPSSSTPAQSTPVRLIMFLAHDPKRTTRLAGKLTNYYKLDKVIYNTLPTLDAKSERPKSSFETYEFQITHSDNDSLPSDTNAASASSSSSQSPPADHRKPANKITYGQIVKVPAQNSSHLENDKILNVLLHDLFETIKLYVLIYDVQEIILVTETNLLYSGRDICMLPEIINRLNALIKASLIDELRLKLKIIDFSNANELANNEAKRKFLHEKGKIPLVMGFQEGGGGPAQDLEKDELFKELFELATIENERSMSAINQFSMTLMVDKTFSTSSNFTGSGTSYDGIIQKRKRFSMNASLASPSPSSRSITASASRTPSSGTTPHTAKSNTPESTFVSKSFYAQWPDDRVSPSNGPITSSMYGNNAPFAYSPGLNTASNSPESSCQSPNFFPMPIRAPLGRPVSYATNAVSASSIPSIVRADSSSSASASTASISKSWAPTASSNANWKRPTPIKLPSYSVPTSPNSLEDPVTLQKLQKSISLSASEERKPIEKQRASSKDDSSSSGTLRSLSDYVGEGQMSGPPRLFLPQPNKPNPDIMSPDTPGSSFK